MPYKIDGFGERLAQRLIAVGYRHGIRGGPDVGRFAREHGYGRQNVYNWLRGTTPDNTALARLADDLDTPEAWFLVGFEGAQSIYAFRSCQPNGLPLPSPRLRLTDGYVETRTNGHGVEPPIDLQQRRRRRSAGE